MMKKKLIILLFSFILFIFPRYLKAEYQIINATLIGKQEITIGKEMNQTLKISFDHYGRDENIVVGVWDICYKIEFDNSVLTIEDVISDNDNWKNTIYKEIDEIYIISEYDYEKNIDICKDGVLSCGDYNVTLKFYVKDTNLTLTTLKISEITADAFVVKNENPIYYLDNSFELKYKKISKDFIIKPNTNTSSYDNEQAATIYSEKPKTEIPKTNNSDNYLKSLVIVGHYINFSKFNNEYNIILKENEDSLNIKATPNDENATVKITGQDNLNESNNKVTIVVTSKNGKTNKYIINVKKAEVLDKSTDTITKKENKIIAFLKNNLKYIIIGVGIIFLILVIVIIVNIIEDKKIDKKLDL